MSTTQKNIDDITRTKTALTGDERLPGRDSTGDFKITVENMISSVRSVYPAEEMKMFSVHKEISETFPWFNMSYPDQNWTTDHYATEFIDEMRSRKVIYDEMNTNVSSFTGSWSSGVFTLDNNTANNAMIAELAEEYLFAGSPVTNWRLLNDGTYDFNIIAITVASREIEVSTADHTPTGTSIEIYLHRVYGSTTSARHHSWAGLGLYMIGGNKVSGLRRRDAMQRITGTFGRTSTVGVNLNSGELSGAFSQKSSRSYKTSDAVGTSYNIKFDSADSPDARTATKTRIESGTLSLYLYVGSYTA